MRLKLGYNGVFGIDAHYPRHFLAVNEQQQSRRFHHTIFQCGEHVAVNVNFADFDATVPFGCQLLDNRRDHLARLAVHAREVHQHGLFRG